MKLQVVEWRDVAMKKYCEGGRRRAFVEIVRAVLGKDDHLEDSEEKVFRKIPQNHCHDQIVGIVAEICERSIKPCDVPFKRVNVDYGGGEINGRTENRIVIVLESPHKYEFRKCGKDWISDGPACYCTGCRLARNWRKIFGQRFGKRELVLVNAVLYQFSLAAAGIKYKRFKDKIVNKCLNEEIFKDDFKTRILALKGNDTFFVNACTGGGKDGTAHAKVSDILKDCKITELDLSHPASWRCPKDVKAQRKKVVDFFDAKNRNGNGLMASRSSSGRRS